MSNIIFYGAGAEAQKNIAKWESEGLVPVCFADADERKHYTKYAGYDILPLDEAITRYPDYLLYLVVGREKLRIVMDSLAKRGIPAERIKVANGVEWRKGCPCMGRMIGYTSSLNTCISWAYAKKIEISGDFETDISKYNGYCNQMLDDWRNGRPTHCDGCNNLREDFWEVKPKIGLLDIGTGKDGHYCNFRCIYCSIPKHTERAQFNERRRYIMSLMRYIYSISPDPSEVTISYAMGEISVTPNIDELISFWRDSGFRVSIVSNASVFNDNIADFLKDCNAVMHTSIDAGTKETFAQIKGFDMFGQVVSNLKRYSDNGAEIQLKYIMLDGVNNNEEDVCGFLDIAAGIKAEVFLSSDHHRTKQRLSDNALEMCMFFINECLPRGLAKPHIMREYFHRDDLQHIEQAKYR